MALASAYVLPITRIPDLFERIRDGQAPERFTQQLLKDWGFTSANDRAFIPLLKALGFLSADGKPTQQYLDYRDHSRSKRVLGEAIRQAYSEIFLIKENPTQSDRESVEGKFKSFHNASDNVASLMMKTSYALLAIADIKQSNKNHEIPPAISSSQPPLRADDKPRSKGDVNLDAQLHYNIQIHLPPTKDIEVYNAIFKSLKEHLLG